MKNGQFESVADDKKYPTNFNRQYTPWVKNYKNADSGEVPGCVYADNLISYFNSAEVK